MAISRREVLGGIFLASAGFPVPSGTKTAFAQSGNLPTVEVEINGTSAPTDDYLTWAPTPARIRFTGTTSAPVVVTLTNDPEQPLPEGRTQPLDGLVAFADKVAPGETATQPALQVTLPPDGSWVPFVVAGAYPRASTADKDAVIEVHSGDAAGPIVGTHAVMVRVRKNIDSLTPAELTAFLKAMRDLHMEANGFELFPIMHDLASQGKFPYQEAKLPNGTLNPKYWPDQAHGGAAFLPWHRAFLLLFERRLQAINPAVTIPYWRINAATKAFDRQILGTNRRSVDTFQTEVIFSPANWLYGWSIAYKDLKTVIRSPKDTSWLKMGNGKPLIGDTELFGATPPYPDADKFGEFRRGLEDNPHNFGHALLGAWHANCLISPSDPSFWPFHAEHDRLWAQWQWHYDRFDTVGTNTDSYNFIGAFIPNDTKVTTLGHNLKDAMWPWDGTSGRVVDDDESRGNRPDQNPFGAFPKAVTNGTWPAADAQPRPADMIDYFGLTGALPHGVAYDNVPFGVRPQPPVVSVSDSVSLESVLAETIRDSQAPVARRFKALTILRNSGHSETEAILKSIMQETASPKDLRQLAAADLIGGDPARGAEFVLELLQQQSDQSGPLMAAIIEAAPVIHHGNVPKHLAHHVHHALMRVATDVSNEQAVPAAVSLAQMNDPHARVYLTDLLAAPSIRGSLRAQLVTALTLAPAGTTPTLSDVLAKAMEENDTETALAVIRALAGDSNSRALRLELVDADADPLINRAAIRSLMRETQDIVPKLLAYIEAELNPAQPNGKWESAGAFRIAVQTFRPFPVATVDEWKTRIQTARDKAPATAAEFKEALTMTLEVLEHTV